MVTDYAKEGETQVRYAHTQTLEAAIREATRIMSPEKPRRSAYARGVQ
jgi:hypothetical protein